MGDGVRFAAMALEMLPLSNTLPSRLATQLLALCALCFWLEHD